MENIELECKKFATWAMKDYVNIGIRNNKRIYVNIEGGREYTMDDLWSIYLKMLVFKDNK